MRSTNGTLPRASAARTISSVQRFGLFGKVRPGFVSFSRSLNLIGTRQLTFAGFPFVQGDFEFARRTFFANDLGGVLEFYPTRRWAVRFDAGARLLDGEGQRARGVLHELADEIRFPRRLLLYP